MTTRRILNVVARLKWTLTLRYFSRHKGNAVTMILALLAFSALAVGAGMFLLVACQEGGPGFRDPALLWATWIMSLLWLSAPFMQFDAQRNLDLNGLRLLPLSRRSFTMVVMLDAALSPIGVFFALLTVLGIVAFSLSAVEVLTVIVVYSLLWVCWLSLGQAIFLWANRLLMSRRFTDASIVVGIIIFFAAQSANLLIHSTDEYALPAWLATVLTGAWAVIKPATTWLFPGAAANLVANASAGQFPLALGLLMALALQAWLCWTLAKTAVRQFYEGELESGGQATAKVSRKQVKTGPAKAMLKGALGAIFHRERLYLWRDPTMKMQQLQTMFGAVYFVILAVIFRINAGGSLSFMQDNTGYLLLIIALMMSFTESTLMFNKFGPEGPQVANLLVSPVDRVTLLRSKSLYSMTHFAAVNLVLIIVLAAMLRSTVEFAIAAGVMVVVNTAVIDVVGHFISIYFPFGYVRRGRRVRAVMPQPGCGYLILYTFVFQVANLAVLPVSLSLGLGVIFYGWAGLLGGFAIAGLVFYLAYRIGLPLAATHLERREPELLAALVRSPE